MDGFHGFMWIGSGLISNYSDFADDAFGGSISDAWLDNHYVPNVSGSDDQCPVAYAVGANEADATNRLFNERYDNVFSDPGSIGWWHVTYIAGLRPGQRNRAVEEMAMRMTPKLAGLTLALAAGAALAQDQPIEPQPPAPREVLREDARPGDPALGRGRSWCSPTPRTGPRSSTCRPPPARSAPRSSAGELQRAPNGAEQVETEARRSGSIRRAATCASSTGAPRSTSATTSARCPTRRRRSSWAWSLLARLGLPAQEFAKPLVETQMAAGGSAGAEKPERVDEVYRLFVVQRVVNELPVFGSDAVVAVNDRAEVQRAKAAWPAFRMDRSDKLLERGAVLEEAADVLVDSGVSEKAAITASLGYAPVGGLPGNLYVPVAMIAVVDGETPMLALRALGRAGRHRRAVETADRSVVPSPPPRRPAARRRVRERVAPASFERLQPVAEPSACAAAAALAGSGPPSPRPSEAEEKPPGARRWCRDPAAGRAGWPRARRASRRGAPAWCRSSRR